MAKAPSIKYVIPHVHAYGPSCLTLTLATVFQLFHDHRIDGGWELLTVSILIQQIVVYVKRHLVHKALEGNLNPGIG